MHERHVGSFTLGVCRKGQRHVLGQLRQQGCCRVMFPRQAPSDNRRGLDAVLVNTSGGLVAGDRLDGELVCHERAVLSVATQGAERVYRLREKTPPIRMTVRAQVAHGAMLEWLPCETIFYNGAAYHRRMRVDLAQEGAFLYGECRVFGRLGAGERIETLSFRDHVSIYREGRPLFIESLRLESGQDNVQHIFAHAAVMRQHSVMLSVIWVPPHEQRDSLAHMLKAAREVVMCYGRVVEAAVSSWNGVLVVRACSARLHMVWPLMRQLMDVLRNGRKEPLSWQK